MQKNILILSHSYGMQFVESCNQYAKLFDQKYKTYVIYLSGVPCADIQKKTLADEVIFLNLKTKDLRGLKLKVIFALYQFCRAHTVEAVICQRYKPSYAMLWVAQLCHIPTLLFVMHAPETMKSWSRKLLVYLLLRKNMFLVGVSKAIENDMRKDLPALSPQRIITFYNIIDPHTFEPQFLSREATRKFLKISNDTFVFGNIARLVIDKDQTTLIKAFAIVKKKHANVKLILMGNGKLEKHLKQLTKNLNLENDIIFTGFIADAFQFMKGFDVFVLPSASEAFGRVLLEAMIAKIPIIATRIEGIPEVMGDTGMLIEANNVEVLANEMMKVMQLAETEKIKMVEHGYQRMIEHFTFAQFEKIFWQSPVADFL